MRFRSLPRGERSRTREGESKKDKEKEREKSGEAGRSLSASAFIRLGPIPWVSRGIPNADSRLQLFIAFPFHLSPSRARRGNSRERPGTEVRLKRMRFKRDYARQVSARAWGKTDVRNTRPRTSRAGSRDNSFSQSEITSRYVIVHTQTNRTLEERIFRATEISLHFEIAKRGNVTLAATIYRVNLEQAHAHSYNSLSRSLCFSRGPIL